MHGGSTPAKAKAQQRVAHLSIQPSRRCTTQVMANESAVVLRGEGHFRPHFHSWSLFRSEERRMNHLV
jgi:hypothetical protein